MTAKTVTAKTVTAKTVTAKTVTAKTVTAKTWMDRLSALVAKHVEQLHAGEITEAQANLELEEMTLTAEMQMTPEEFEEFFRHVMVMDYAVEAQLSQDGRPVPGNDPKRPN